MKINKIIFNINSNEFTSCNISKDVFEESSFYDKIDLSEVVDILNKFSGKDIFDFDKNGIFILLDNPELDFQEEKLIEAFNNIGVKYNFSDLDGLVYIKFLSDILYNSLDIIGIKYDVYNNMLEYNKKHDNSYDMNDEVDLYNLYLDSSNKVSINDFELKPTNAFIEFIDEIEPIVSY